LACLEEPGEAVEKTVIAHRKCLSEPIAVDNASEEGTADTTRRLSRRRRRRPTWSGQLSRRVGVFVRHGDPRAARHRASPARPGQAIRAITRELRLDRKTVRRIVQADDVEDLIAKTTSRHSLLDNYKPYLSSAGPAAT